jgi:hypothetical protein
MGADKVMTRAGYPQIVAFAPAATPLFSPRLNAPPMKSIGVDGASWIEVHHGRPGAHPSGDHGPRPHDPAAAVAARRRGRRVPPRIIAGRQGKLESVVSMKITLSAAMRARDVSRPSLEQLAEAAAREEPRAGDDARAARRDTAPAAPEEAQPRGRRRRRPRTR